MNPNHPLDTRQLAAPLLPQASNSVLNMASIQASSTPQVQVYVPRASQPNYGDTIVLFFRKSDETKVVRYAYLERNEPGTDSRGFLLPVLPLSVLRNGDYRVWYEIRSRFDNHAQSEPVQIRVIDEVSATMSSYYQNSFFGQYLPGRIDSWLVPYAYTLDGQDPGVIRALDGQGSVSASVTLMRQRPHESRPSNIGKLLCRSGQWSITLDSSSVELGKGDALTLSLDGAAPALLAFEFAL